MHNLHRKCEVLKQLINEVFEICMKHIIESKLDFYCVGHLCAVAAFWNILMDFCDKEIWPAMWYNYPKSQCCIFC